MHNLTIVDGRIYLDGIEVRFVESFKLESSTDGTAELSLKMTVKVGSTSLSQHGRDDLPGNLSKNA